MRSGVRVRIWLDADGCPNDVKDVVFKASLRLHIPVVLVADRWFRLPPHPHLQLILVAQGADSADDHIVEHATTADLVVTEDIPLASRLVKNQVTVISRRGTVFTETNIGERLATRDLMDGLRGSGMQTGGPRPYGPAEKKRFAEAFDRELTRLHLKASKG